jgi:tRNA pseudouridine38-40 synthase
MARIALGIEYDGSAFCGWQTQPHGCGVQDAVERALRTIAGHPVSTICAGRTDAGVHAVAQVVHFDSDAVRPASAWVRGVNALLQDAAGVVWATVVADEFHARYGAQERHYRYLLADQAVRPVLNRHHVGWTHHSLSIEAMRAAASHLVGQHDFSAFRSSECQARSPVRDLRRIEIERSDEFVTFDLSANAFLHHMVRNIVGSLAHVGAGRESPHWLKDVLNSRDRARAAPTISPCGLYLADVRYDAKFALPQARRAIWFQRPGT